MVPIGSCLSNNWETEDTDQEATQVETDAKHHQVSQLEAVVLHKILPARSTDQSKFGVASSLPQCSSKQMVVCWVRQGDNLVSSWKRVGEACGEILSKIN